MELLNKNDVTSLYLKYGFEIGPSTDDYLVFFSRNGYFQNAEIIQLNDFLKNENSLKEEYESLGYSVRVSKYQDILSIHNSLFNGFFNTKLAVKKLNTEYDSFCIQQNAKLANCNYEYIVGNYLENGLLKEDNIIDRICELFALDDRQLMILEASAGYGKTCTSFEVINHITKLLPMNIPLITELSKNRKANVFRYVLLSEIDQKFPTLSSELVTSEIENGRIFLIIDGFDELLSKGYSSVQEKDKNSKDAQTMLDTISQLFSENSKTKILLTTRKSSIFVGETFDDWVEKHLDNCNITRFQLQEPSLKDWLGHEKIEMLNRNDISLDNILNPVLLTFLRNAELDDFEKICTSSNKIIDQYLDLLLNREQIRQALILSNDEQLDIMSELAGQMVQYDISAEEIDFIKDILLDIVKYNIKDYLNRYNLLLDSSEIRPTETQFITKLSQHALIDRVSAQNNMIGFINDFIFGYMIGKCIIDEKLSPIELQGKYFDIAVTSFASCDTEKRTALYNKIVEILKNVSAQQKINATMCLLKEINGIYTGEYFDSIVFNKNLKITGYKLFTNCTFYDCVFDNCIINTDAFYMCHFYNCTFFNNRISAGTTMNCQLVFLGCTGSAEFASASCRNEKKEYEHIDEVIDYERIILEQFWKPGYEKAEPYRKFQVLIKGIASNNAQKVENAVESLVKKDILIKRMRVYELNFNKIDEIKYIIKR